MKTHPQPNTDSAHTPGPWIDARLIAASPDLLAALETVLPAYIALFADLEEPATVTGSRWADVELARAAIAKAKGVQS